MNQITYELHNHDWYLCVDGRRCAKLLSPFCHAQVEHAITAQAQAAGDAAVQMMLKLLDRARSGELSPDELNNYVTPLAAQP